MSRTLLLLVAAIATGCPKERLVADDADLTVEPGSLRFEAAFVGFGRQLPITLQNHSRAALQVTTGIDAPFSAPEAIWVPAGDSIALEVTFAPAIEGEVSATLELHWAGRVTRIDVSGVASLAPACKALSPCVTSRFDDSLGRCVESPAAEGESCGQGNQCLIGGRCVAGACVGAALQCDDQNACTHDLCDPSAGCVHQDLSETCPRPSGACQVAICLPATGCGVAVAADGTSCGPNDCSTAQVCIGGACESRAAPEGSTCAPENACQGPGLCHHNVCERPAAGSPRLAWRYTPSNPAALRYTGVMDPDANVYFVESDDRTTQLVSLDARGGVRFRQTLQVQCRYCTFYVGIVLDPESSRVYLGLPRGIQEARDSTDGHLLWRADLTVGLPVGDPMPDGGAYFGSVRAHPLGNFLCGDDAFCSGVASEVMEGYTDHRSYIVGLNPANGQVLWRIYRKGHLYSPVVSGDELFVSSANCWAMAGDYERFSTANGQRRGGGFIQGYPSAINAGTSLFWGPGLRMVDPQLNDLPVALGALPTGAPLIATNRIVVLTDRGVNDVDPVTRAVRWTAPVQGTRSLELMLGSNGDTLAAGTGPDGGTFAAIDPSGRVTLECPLPEIPTSPIALAKGHYVAQFGTDLLSFDVPGYDASWTGWSASAGSLARDARSR